MWSAAQRLRKRSQTVPNRPRWLGTSTQLSVVIGGSIILGGADEEPAIVPLATDATPTVKGSPSGPLIRLEGPPNKSGRYVSLSVVIGSSEGIWPAALAVGNKGGRNAGGLRASGGRPVMLQAIASSPASVAFQLVDMHRHLGSVGEVYIGGGSRSGSRRRGGACAMGGIPGGLPLGAARHGPCPGGRDSARKKWRALARTGSAVEPREPEPR
mmetsp:Transcript_5802/g.8852  ORF Transcript_5802/g.8852 Transcript_5802/m.8852 type:complete len:213 (+) Transcript_5802:101-739(+)